MWTHPTSKEEPMRITAAVSTLVLSAAVVAGCGSGDGDGTSAGSGDYCKSLEAAEAEFAALGSGTTDFTLLSDAIDTFHDLADGAPPEVSAEWKTVEAAFTALEDGLADAGLSFEDLGAITSGDLPDGMTTDELTALGPKLEETFSSLDEKDVDEAGEKIEKHAKSECGIDLVDE